MTNIRKSSQINFHSSKSVHGSVAGPEPDAPIYNYTTGLFINIFPISKYFPVEGCSLELRITPI